MLIYSVCAPFFIQFARKVLITAKYSKLLMMKKYFKYSCTNSLIFGTVAWSRVCNENCIANRNLICRHQTGNRSWLKSTRWSLCVYCLSWWFSSERKQTRINGLIHDVLTSSRDIFQRYFPNSPFTPGIAVILQCFFFSPRQHSCVGGTVIILWKHYNPH